MFDTTGIDLCVRHEDKEERIVEEENNKLLKVKRQTDIITRLTGQFCSLT